VALFAGPLEVANAADPVRTLAAWRSYHLDGDAALLTSVIAELGTLPG
jgi:hypothetical protein